MAVTPMSPPQIFPADWTVTIPFAATSEMLVSLTDQETVFVISDVDVSLNVPVAVHCEMFCAIH